jgi:son of sevenless-like protein
MPGDDYDQQTPSQSAQQPNVVVSRSRSNSNVSATNSQPELAGFGVQKRSNTPDGWMKRLADDGMSYYYVNSLTGETRWTPPSPRVNGGGPRLRADSDATYDSNRLSVYSDSSEIHPYVDPSSSTRPVTLPIPPPPLASDVGAAEEAAKQLQTAMQPPSADSFAELVDATRGAIRGLLEASELDVLPARVDETVQAVRSLLYCSGTLVVGIRMHDEPSENDEIINLRLKPLQRKVTATLSKVVLSARAVRLNGSFPSATLGRVHQDAADLEASVTKFADEVEKAKVTNPGGKRLTGVLLSGDGAAGVGVGLVGAGIGGGWKGLGFVPTEETGAHRRLGTSLITEFQDQKAILDERCQILAVLFASNVGLEVQEGT